MRAAREAVGPHRGGHCFHYAPARRANRSSTAVFADKSKITSNSHDPNQAFHERAIVPYSQDDEKLRQNLPSCHVKRECGLIAPPTIDINAALRSLLEGLLNAVMDEQASELGVPRNGYRERSLDTCVGRVTLRIPKLREGT